MSMTIVTIVDTKTWRVHLFAEEEIFINIFIINKIFNFLLLIICITFQWKQFFLSSSSGHEMVVVVDGAVDVLAVKEVDQGDDEHD